ncbi:MAG: methyltransferase domain-containing protein [Deltaproteobacteria bacterium]|nr:methyltransferase domain-containing protein [Deltaproteobacteria bacterium]
MIAGFGRSLCLCAEPKGNMVSRRLKYAVLPYVRHALQAENSSERRLVLDVGCGPGKLADFCSSLTAYDWYGLDLWEHELLQAKEIGSYKSVFQVNLLNGLPFRDNAFHVVVCKEVLMYLPNDRELFREFYRVLRPGGKVFIYNPIAWFPKTYAALKRLGRSVYQASDSVTLDTQSEWRTATRPCRIAYLSFDSLMREIREANFEILDVTAFRLFRNRIRLMARLEDYDWYLNFTQKLAARRPRLATDLMVVGRKV